MNDSFLKVAEQLSQIPVRKQEVVLPIARKKCVVDPLKVGDDASIRTSVLSPASYDNELVKLLFHRSNYLEESDIPIWNDFELFTKELSNIDKTLLIWALYRATYKTLGPRKITCPHCNETNIYEIKLDDLIQEDSFTIWDKTVILEEGQEPSIIKFNEYTYNIDIDYDGSIIRLGTRIPTIYDNNKVLRLITPEEIQKNLEISGTPYSRTHELCLIIRNITIIPGGDESKQVMTDNLQDILISFERYFSNDIYEEFITKYNDHFLKYVPRFYSNYACPNCEKNIEYEVNIEAEFFRRCLYGKEEPE